MSLIDNNKKTLLDSLKNTLKSSDSIDIVTGFFYFSGYKLLAKDIKDKKIRILVGLEIEPDLIPQIAQDSKEDDVDLSRFQFRRPTQSRTELKENYIKAFIGLMNDTDIFDDPLNLDFMKYLKRNLMTEL